MHHVWLEFVQERWYEVKLYFQIVDLSNIQEQTLPRPLPKAVAEPQTSSDNKERSRLTNQTEEEQEKVLTDIQHAAKLLKQRPATYPSWKQSAFGWHRVRPEFPFYAHGRTKGGR